MMKRIAGILIAFLMQLNALFGFPTATGELAGQADAFYDPDTVVDVIVELEEKSMLESVSNRQECDAMVDSIREDTVRMLFTIQIRQQVPKRQIAGNETRSNKGYTARNRRKKIGPNDPCPCGSGKKYKKCCGASAANANAAGDE